jgi:hypothetical protein
MQRGQAAWICSIGMENGHANGTEMMDKQHGQAA